MIIQRTGTVVSLNTRPTSGIPKIPRPGGVIIGEHGFVDDYHNQPLRKSYSVLGALKENLWHISILAREVYDDLNRDPELAEMRLLVPGDLGEGITVEGLGDLSDVKDGTVLLLEGGIELRYVEHMTPCVVIGALHKKLGKQIYSRERNRRGIYCSIKEGRGRPLSAGSRIEVIPPGA